MVFDVLIFGVTFWLGLYLVSRDLSSPRLRFAGLGLVSYALGWGCTILSPYAPAPAFGTVLTRLCWSFYAFPAVFWTGAIITLLPEDGSLRARLARVWSYGVLPVAAFGFLLSVSTPLLFDRTTSSPRLGFAYFIFSAVAWLPLLGVLCLLWCTLRSIQPKNARGIFLVSLLFLTLSTGLLLSPQEWLQRTWILLLVSLDLLVLGVVIVVLDAFDQGESFLPDVFRSFDFSLGTALIFAGQVILVILLWTGPTFPMLLLLLTTIATSIAVQAFSNQLGTLLDRLAFANFPQLRKARADLRTTASTLPRLNQALDFEALDEVEFTHLTRRALSHYGDLSRLAASPLTYLPLVDMRLAKQGAKGDALGRAIELKALLTESIARLKPQQKGDFGTSDEWRYYNALYFPYVVGIKPYSRRAQNGHIDPVAQAALEWFRTNVPERTLHNWQTAATKLLAQDLREKRNM